MANPVITLAKLFETGRRSTMSYYADGAILTQIIYDNDQLTLTARTSVTNTTPDEFKKINRENFLWIAEIIERYNPPKGDFPLCDYKISKKSNATYQILGNVGDLKLHATYDADTGNPYTGRLTFQPRPAAIISLNGFLLFNHVYKEFLHVIYHETYVDL